MRKRSRSETSVSNAGSRTEPEYEFTDEQWQLIADLFPNPKPSKKGGRPPAPPRVCVEGILWILRTGARWKDLPDRFPSKSTCWRRLDAWTRDGIWEKAWARLVRMLDRQGALDRTESFADGSFASAKKGGNASEKLNEVRGPRSWSSPMAMECLTLLTQLALVPTK